MYEFIEQEDIFRLKFKCGKSHDQTALVNTTTAQDKTEKYQNHMHWITYQNEILRKERG